VAAPGAMPGVGLEGDVEAVHAEQAGGEALLLGVPAPGQRTLPGLGLLALDGPSQEPLALLALEPLLVGFVDGQPEHLVAAIFANQVLVAVLLAVAADE